MIAVPLLPPEPAVLLDLQAAFDRAYDAGPYRKAVWYGEDAIDPSVAGRASRSGPRRL